MAWIDVAAAHHDGRRLKGNWRSLSVFCVRTCVCVMCFWRLYLFLISGSSVSKKRRHTFIFFCRGIPFLMTIWHWNGFYINFMTLNEQTSKSWWKIQYFCFGLQYTRAEEKVHNFCILCPGTNVFAPSWPAFIKITFFHSSHSVLLILHKRWGWGEGEREGTLKIKAS